MIFIFLSNLNPESVPYEVLYVEMLNTRKYEVEPLSDRQEKHFREYFKQDILLYDFFNQSLHRKIENFGTQVPKQKILFLTLRSLDRTTSRTNFFSENGGRNHKSEKTVRFLQPDKELYLSKSCQIRRS